MDAIALSMFIEPVPTPRSEAPLLDASFDALVAAVSGEGPEAEDAPDTPSDDATSQPDLMSALVSQWLAQTDQPPAPVSERGIQYEQPDAIGQEPAAAPQEPDEPALSLESPLQTGATDIPPEEAEAGDQIAQKPQDNGASPDDDAIVSESGPSEGEAPVTPRARNEEPKVSFLLLQLMQQAAEIGWTLSTPEASRAAAPTTANNDSETRQGAVEKPAPTLAAQSVASFSAEITEPSAKEPATPAPASDVPIDHEAKAIDSKQAKATKAPNRADNPEQPAPTQATPRAAESLVQTSPNPPINAIPNSQPRVPDSISVPQPASISVAATNSADMPVKLMATSHEEQTAEMQTLALHIAARSAKGDSKFAIRLDPPELGQIDVNLSVNSHGHAQAVLAVEKPQTLDLLLRDAPTLERALKDAGLELGGNLSFSLKEEGQQGFARNDQYSPPTKTLELVPTEAPKAQAALSASIVEQLYGLRTARLDIMV